MITYEINSHRPERHIFDIDMHLEAPHPDGQLLSLPIWIPGSYLVRDFARHVVSIEAFEQIDNTLSKVKITKINSNTWQCAKVKGALKLSYAVYAFDPSVRGAYLDDEYGFFNGASLFLCPQGQEEDDYLVKINPPHCLAANNWQVATTLTRESAAPFGFGSYRAQSYDALLDNPVQMGQFAITEFKAHGIAHTIAISGKHSGCIHQLTQDVQKICEAQLSLFKENAPFSEYLFLLHVKKESYGGLEHRNSTALQIPRECMPLKNEAIVNPNYLILLALFSHEYFHAWNIKKIKPHVFLPYNLNDKAYTKQLWAYEGITSYYDDLILARSKVITLEQYLDVLAQAITKFIRTPGRKKQTLAESSFDAWIKFYQPNENTPNAGVSYYLKGSLVALLADMVLRLQTDKTLDDLMRMLYKEFGQKNIGTPEDEIENLLSQWGGATLAELMREALYTTAELPLAQWFSAFGLELTYRVALNNEDLGGKKAVPLDPSMRDYTQRGQFNWIIQKVQGKLIIVTVLDDGCAQKAGIIPNDEIIAINGLKVDAESFDKMCKRLNANDKIVIHLFRQDVLKEVTGYLDPLKLDTVQITVKSQLTEKEKMNLNKWLND